MENRERLPPESLPAEEPVAELVVDRRPAEPGLREIGRHPRDEGARLHPRVGTGIDRLAVAGEKRPVVAVARKGLDDRDDLQAERPGKLPVAVVVGRHGHDRAGAVGRQDVVSHPHRHRLARERMDAVRAGEDAGLLLGQIGAIEIALSRGGFPVDSDRLLLVGRRQRVDERMLRSDDEVGDAVEGVGTCRVDAEDIPTGLEGESRGAAGRLPGGESCVSRARGGDREVDLGAGAPADPVGLELLDARRPVEGLELLLQSIGVGGDPQHPLAQRDADDRMAAALAHPPDHLLVGEHRAQGRAPVDRRLRLVGEAVEIAVGGDGYVPPGRDVGGDRQFGDRAPLLLPGVEPGVEEDEKDPLRPANVFRIGG